ncbi:MAG TPA: glycosyltransferase [Acidimicrobiia bacterium]|nr:glycosyltransferase [Acidimicrobiia bacterium]
MALEQVRVRGIPPERLEVLIGAERTAAFVTAAADARTMLEGRVVWNLNSTATGGGVAELLQTLLAYARGAGIDARWAVINGDPRFFQITKRIHNRLYGQRGDGGPLGAAERRDYERTTARNADDLAALVRPGDIVVLHDPQTAGLVAEARRRGAVVVWRCHVGLDATNSHSAEGWAFLRPYVEHVDAWVFSCARFAPEWVPSERLTVVAPSIDPFSAKNEPIETADVVRTLRTAGLLASNGPAPDSEFTRRDGTKGRVHRAVDPVGTGPAPPADVPIVLQASRWDALKDMPGVMLGFADHLPDMGDAHLILAGPEAIGVADDPEAAMVLAECRALWGKLPARAQERIRLACVPMADPDEAAAIVNALQRQATVIVQKSFAEGFGLTVAEAMWKRRPVVGSAVGGIMDQIVSGETGWLLRNPADLDEYAYAVGGLLADRAEASRMGERGYDRARSYFLADRHLEQWGELLARAAGG